MKLLFAINGLGLGNSTRCWAIIQKLALAGVECHVVTSGNGETFFRDKTPVQSLHSMPGLAYAWRAGRLSVQGTLRRLPESLSALRAKAARLEQVLDLVEPDGVVVDSEYVTGPYRKRRVPLAAVNNSRYFFSSAWRNAPRGSRSHFWTVELLDHLFHLAVPDLVLAPCPRTIPRSERFRPLGLVVRQEFLNRSGPRATAPREVRHALYLPGGSFMSTRSEPPLDELPFPVRRLGPDPNLHPEEIIAADFLIVGGGWSSVCEVMALGKPAVTIPLPGHSEQYFNAQLLERWGFGQCLSGSELVPAMQRQWKKNRWERKPSQQPRGLTFHGAEVACQALLEWLSPRRGRL